jgi:hypothetical protein
MTDLKPCDECGQPHVTKTGHPSCVGHRKKKYGGGPCAQHPMHGQTVCKTHGGMAKQNREAGARRQAEAQAVRDVELFAGRRDIHPAEALLELVQWTAGEVDYWRQEVTLLEREDLTWGVTKVKDGGDDRGTTSEAKPHIAYAMLIDASNRLERYSSAALKANIDERRVRLAEAEGRALAGVIQRILAALELTPEQAELVHVVVPRELRAIAAGVDDKAAS